MKRITLGLDIGTAFCYAGYFDGPVFKQAIVPDALPDDMEDLADYTFVQTHGIPSVVAIRKRTNSPGGYEYKFGIDAENAIMDDNSQWAILPVAIKDLLRNGAKTASFCFPNERPIPLPLFQRDDSNQIYGVFVEFIRFLKGEIEDCINARLGAGKWEYSSIVFAYPNVLVTKKTRDETLEYQSLVTEVIERVFKCPRVDAHSESSIISSCLNTLLEHNHGSFCTIDVGGGTTDISYNIWNDQKQKYLPLYAGESPSIPFGGERVDEALVRNGKMMRGISAWGKIQAKQSLFSAHGGLDDTYLNISHDDTKEALQDMVQNEVSELFEDVRSRLANIRTRLFPDGGNVAVVAMGGSMRLPFVKRMVEDVFQRLKFVDPQELNDKFGITNANFIAYSAARYNGEDTLPPTTIALHYRSERDQNYHYALIANEFKATSGLHYFLTMKHYKNCKWEIKDEPERFNVPYRTTKDLFRLVLKKSFAGDVIDQSEAAEYIDKEQSEELTSFIGHMQPIDKEYNQKGIYTGIVYNAGAYSEEAKLRHGEFSVYFYADDEKKTCFYDSTKQPEITFEEFWKKAGLPKPAPRVAAAPLSQPAVSHTSAGVNNSSTQAVRQPSANQNPETNNSSEQSSAQTQKSKTPGVLGRFFNRIFK